ncbi:hypothetical protein O1L55_40905 [Streptomyces albulus]|nr:hypothetical protein [Streptomyces noursei]
MNTITPPPPAIPVAQPLLPGASRDAEVPTGDDCLPAALGSGTVSPADTAVLQALAEGADEQVLRDRGHYATSVGAFRGVAALGRRLNAGVPIRWTGIVHLSVVHKLIAVEAQPPVWLSPFQLDLLRAWAKGLSLESYAYEACLSMTDAQERAYFLCMRLKASGDQHAVLRAHQMTALTTDDPLIVTFHTGGS